MGKIPEFWTVKSKEVKVINMADYIRKKDKELTEELIHLSDHLPWVY